MSATLTPEQETHEVVRLKNEEEKTFAEIAQELGFSESTAKRRYAAATIVEAAQTLAGGEDLEVFPEVEVKQLKVSNYIPEDKTEIERFKPLVATGDAIVTCDLHIPLHDPVLINTMIAAAKKTGIKKLLIGGDYFHMEEFSSFLPYQPEAALETEKHDGNLIMKTFCRHFDEIYIIWGNHDFRLAKKMGYKKSFIECMEWMLSELTEVERKKIKISDLDYMHYLPTGNKGRKFRLCHPRNFSSIPLTVPRDLARKYSCSIITAHSHHLAMGVAPNGYDLIIDGGGFFCKERTEYIQKTTNNHEWVPGFTIFKDGVPEQVSPVFGTDLKYRKGVK